MGLRALPPGVLCARARPDHLRAPAATVGAMSGPNAADSGDLPAAPAEPGGMGAIPSGPEFLPAPPTIDEPPWRPSRSAERPPPYRNSRWPNVISATVIVLVGLVVLIASSIARYGDTHVTAPTPVVVPSVQSEPSTPSEIEFTTPDGSGRLILLSRSWRDTGREPPMNGNYLQLEVKIICTSGRLDYDPYNFQAFDHTGELFDVASAGVSEDVLGVGELFKGQSTHGYLAFDIPRGEVTLLMSDDSEQSITALKIPD